MERTREKVWKNCTDILDGSRNQDVQTTMLKQMEQNATD